MSTYTAIIGDTSSVGTQAANQDPSSTTANRRNPAVATARIRSILNPHTVSDSVGGFISADFTIPPEEAQLWRPLLRYGAVCWLFDGATPIFHGWLEKPTWGDDGSALINVSGAWLVLGKALTREAWDLWDMTLLTRGTGANENKSGQFNVNSDGSCTFSFPNGTVIAASDRVSVDYLLFGETAGANDQRLITAFEFDISDAAGTALTANRRIRVLGKANAATAGGDLLYDTGSTGSTGRQGALNLHGTNQGAVQWTINEGYRCLRIEYIYTVGVTVSADQYVTLDRIRIGTRENLFQSVSGGVVNLLDTGQLARDLLKVRGVTTPNPNVFDMPQEFWPSAIIADTTDGNTGVYQRGLDPRIPLSSCPDSGIGVTGFTALEWQSPADILATLAAIDARHIGFYLPYNQRGGYDPPGLNITGGGKSDVGSWWLSAPPTLFYQAFTDPVYNPDYTVQTQEGAQIEQNTDQQPLIDVEYVNYQTLRGRQLSQVLIDADTRNYLYAQGFRRAEDYTFQPSMGDNQGPVALGLQNLVQRRQPYQAATITIQNDGTGRSPILQRGASIPKLATIRPGSLHITDVPAGSGLRSGIATHVEWWGQTDQAPETVQLSLGVPGRPSGHAITLGHIVHGHRRRRHSIF